MFNENSNGLIPILHTEHSEIIESSVCYSHSLNDFGAISGMSECKRYKTELLLVMASIEEVFGMVSDYDVKFCGASLLKLFPYFKKWAVAHQLIEQHGTTGCSAYSTLTDKGRETVQLFWDTYHKRLERFRIVGASQYADYMPYIERKEFDKVKELRLVLPTVKRQRARRGANVNLSKFLANKPAFIKEHFSITDKASELEFS